MIDEKGNEFHFSGCECAKRNLIHSEFKANCSCVYAHIHVYSGLGPKNIPENVAKFSLDNRIDLKGHPSFKRLQFLKSKS